MIDVSGELDRLHVDNIGSFLRPAELLTAFDARAADEIGDTELEHAQDAAIRGIVAAQEAHGLPVITDGEFRRRSFNDSFAEVSGFADGQLTAAMSSRPHDPAAAAGPGRERVQTVLRRMSGRLELVRNRPLMEYSFTQALTDCPVKATLLNTDALAQRFDADGTPKGVYPDTDAFVDDVVRVGRQIISGLVEAGCRYVQIDAARYPAYLSADSRSEMTRRGHDPARALARAVAADNALIAGFPDVTFGLHICRGNRRSQSHWTGPYEEMAEQLGEFRYDRLLLEYDSAAAGGFEPLRFVNDGAVVVLGLITTKSGVLERADDIKRRIYEAARYLPIERLALSTQCGFASVLEGNLLSEDDQWRKIDLMMQVADDVWGT